MVLAPIILAQQPGDQNKIGFNDAKLCLASLLCSYSQGQKLN
jgi:hypothetical protein